MKRNDLAIQMQQAYLFSDKLIAEVKTAKTQRERELLEALAFLVHHTFDQAWITEDLEERLYPKVKKNG